MKEKTKSARVERRGLFAAQCDAANIHTLLSTLERERERETLSRGETRERERDTHTHTGERLSLRARSKTLSLSLSRVSLYVLEEETRPLCLKKIGGGVGPAPHAGGGARGRVASGNDASSRRFFDQSLQVRVGVSREVVHNASRRSWQVSRESRSRARLSRKVSAHVSRSYPRNTLGVTIRALLRERDTCVVSKTCSTYIANAVVGSGFKYGI